MRVTNNMMSNDLLRSLNRNMYRMLALQTQIATGKKINKPSDDPAGLVTSLRLRTNLVEGEQYLENIGDSITFMDTLDSSLNSIGEVMQKIRELTVKAATGSNSDEANEAIAVEIADLNEELKMIANVTYGNKYIFAGTNVTEEPYQDGVWTGNQRALEVEIGVGVTTTINLPGMKEFFMGRLNDLILNSGTSGITSLTANALQEGEYTLKTAIGATAQSRATETQNYLGALANNGEFFYQDVNSAATLGVGKDAAALANDSTLNGSILIESKKVNLGKPQCSMDSDGGKITFDQVIYGINDEGNLAALSSGDRDFESRFTYTGTGSLYTAQYTTDAAGNATIEFSTEGAADGDTIVWNNDYGGTAGSNAGKAYNKDGTDFAPITFTYNGTSGKWEYTGPTTPATVTADIKAHIYSSTGEYKYVELQNVELNMETGAGEAIFTIDKSKLWGGEDLVIYNNGTSALGGIDPTNPQIAVGDKAVISISGQSAAADSQQVNIDYTYRNIDKEEIGSGSHSYVFQAGTLDDKTTDFKFFTLNQQTGLSYEGTISQTTRDFAADDKAASFTYQAGIFDYVADLVRKVQQGKLPEVGNELAGADTRLNELLLDRSTIGARINRLELQQTRLNGTQISLTSLLSDNEDANEAEVIMNLKIQENVYNASLAVGARIIQPTLVDFLS